MQTLPWYVARASGLVGWALLTASVLWGLTISTKGAMFRRRPRPSWLLDLHRFLGGLAVLFTGIHVAAIVADSYLHFDVAAVLVPFASTWHPAAVAWGVVSMYLLAAVEVTSLLRKHLSRRAWRAVHFSSFPLFLTSTTHALTSGTDAGGVAFRVLAAVATGAVVGLTVLRIHQARTKPAARTRVAAVPPSIERVAA